MALDPNATFVNTNNVAFPDNESVNASGPTSTDGTEFVKLMIDNYMFGPQQALLNYASLIPDGVPEADGTSQELEAMQKVFSHPGELLDWYGGVDPSTLGIRILLLHGQGVLIASFLELVEATYVGDGNNGTAPAFYKADDAAGLIRNIGGTFFILPDLRNTDSINDIVVEGVSNAGTALSGLATDIDFTEVVDSNNAWDGTVFDTPEGGSYLFIGSTNYSSSAAMNLYSFIDGVQDRRVGGSNVTANSVHTFAYQADLSQGDLVSFRTAATISLGASTLNHHISIIKVSSATIYSNEFIEPGIRY